MNSMIKKYLPYAIVTFAIFLIVPQLFRSEAMKNLYPVAIYFIFPGTAIVSSTIYCSKYGLDFLFTLISPIAFIPTMLIYSDGFSLANIILLGVYLVSGIFGLFLGDLAFGDKRRQREKEEKAEAEEIMLKAKRRDDRVKEQLEAKREASALADDFDYDKYTADIDRVSSSTSEQEIDDILSEFGSSK